MKESNLYIQLIDSWTEYSYSNRCYITYLLIEINNILKLYERKIRDIMA
jgi:hypothetical protein